MVQEQSSWSLGELATFLEGELRGPAEHLVVRPVAVDSNDPEGIAFAASEKYLRAGLASGVGALIVPEQAPTIPKPAIAVPNPRAAFGRLLALFTKQAPLSEGVDPRSAVAKSAQVGQNVRIGPFAVVEENSVIGAGCHIYSFAYVGRDCVLGEECMVLPHAVLLQDVRLGARCLVHPGAILGSAGFGFEWDGQRQLPIPQVGAVELGDDVEIGALTAIDRATFGVTRIGSGTKLDNLIQIAHNCSIGEHGVIASQTGLSGSTTVGDRVSMGGQTGTSPNARIGDGVRLGARSGVMSEVLEPGDYWGTPVLPIREALRLTAYTHKLPEWNNRLKDLEKRLAALEGRN